MRLCRSHTPPHTPPRVPEPLDMRALVAGLLIALGLLIQAFGPTDTQPVSEVESSSASPSFVVFTTV